MVSLTNITTGQTYQIPFNALDVSYQKQVMATTIAIPLSNEPILLNYGGVQINLSVSFITDNKADVANLIGTFSDASGSVFEVNLLQEWGMPYSGTLSTLGSFQGYITAMNIEQTGGTVAIYKCSFTLMVGQPE